MLDLPENQLQLVRGILQEIAPDREVWAFGSRVKGTAKPYSDLDLVIRGEKDLPIRIMNRLVEAFQESDLPIRVDVLEWCAISPAFRQVIEQKYAVVQPANADDRRVEL